MDKFFHSTFDFFTHAIPGVCIVASFFALDADINSLNDFMGQAGKTNLGGGILLLIIGYITGFAVHPIGRFLYKKLGFKIWNEKIENDIPLFISDKYTIIREFSPANFKYVETWNMFCAMAHNLAVSSLILFVCCLIKIFFYKTHLVFWIFVCAVSTVSFFIFLQRAVRFSIWAAHDINSTISRMDLRDVKIKTDKNQEESGVNKEK